MIRPNMWNAFGMDAKKEIEGVQVEFFGSFRVTIARAGGRNEAFGKAYEIRARPIRKALEIPGAVTKRQREDLVQNVYLDAVIKKFEMNVSDDETAPEWKQVVVWEDGTTADATRENLLVLFNKLPDLFEQIVKEATDLTSYRKEQLQDEAGN